MTRLPVLRVGLFRHLAIPQSRRYSAKPPSSKAAAPQRSRIERLNSRRTFTQLLGYSLFSTKFAKFVLRVTNAIVYIPSPSFPPPLYHPPPYRARLARHSISAITRTHSCCTTIGTGSHIPLYQLATTFLF